MTTTNTNPKDGLRLLMLRGLFITLHDDEKYNEKDDVDHHITNCLLFLIRKYPYPTEWVPSCYFSELSEKMMKSVGGCVAHQA